VLNKLDELMEKGTAGHISVTQALLEVALTSVEQNARGQHAPMPALGHTKPRPRWAAGRLARTSVGQNARGQHAPVPALGHANPKPRRAAGSVASTRVEESTRVEQNAKEGSRWSASFSGTMSGAADAAGMITEG
jgi:hypothetical protein